MGEWGMGRDDSEPGGGFLRCVRGSHLPGSASIDAAGTDW